MKVRLGSAAAAAGISGSLSFLLLAASLGSDYWYIIEVNPAMNMSELNSHSGLWSIHEGTPRLSCTCWVGTCTPVGPTHSEHANNCAAMHRTIVVLLPLSLVLLLLGGICGLVSSLAQSRALLTATASFFFICSLFTLSGVSLYMVYSYRALAETEKLEGTEGLAYIRTSFGWSLALAWLSFGLELLTGALLLAAARLAELQHVTAAY
uniref:Transmembrane protein 235 n=1 Tax=Tetraodon nigroviridis TaxID=99883 RepID=H3D5Q8_TETNG